MSDDPGSPATVTIELPFPLPGATIDPLTVAMLAGAAEGALRAFLEGAKDKWGIEAKVAFSPSAKAVFQQFFPVIDPEERSAYVQLTRNGHVHLALAVTHPAAGEAPSLPELIAGAVGVRPAFGPEPGDG